MTSLSLEYRTRLIASCLIASALVVGGCGRLSQLGLRAGSSAPTIAASPPTAGATHEGAGAAPRQLAQAAQTGDIAPDEVPEHDPWEKFNEKMFAFNRGADKYVLKPTAKVYDKILPEPFQVLIRNAFDNIRWVPRFVNSMLQAKWTGAGREVGRFLINSTLGIGGLFDAAKYWEIRPSKADFGQTLAVWGVGPGPYLILPLLPPTTVRDGIGLGVDGAMNPLAYYTPFVWDQLGTRAGDEVNERALNIDLYQGFEESVVDMYSAVRHGYLNRREKLIRE